MENSELMQDFITESMEHLSNLQDDFLLLEKKMDDPDSELINRIFRAIHTVKGSSGFFGLKNIGELSHIMETVLSLMRTKELSASRHIVDCLLKGADQLTDLIQDVFNSDSPNVEVKTNVLLFSNILANGNEEVLEEISVGDIESDSPKQDKRTIQKSAFSDDPNSLITIYDLEANNSFEFRAITMRNIPKYNDFLYVLRYNIIEFEKKSGKNPLEIYKTLGETGEIIDGVINVPYVDIEVELPKGEVYYQILYSTVVDPFIIDELAGIDSTSIFEIDKEQLFEQLNSNNNSSNTDEINDKEVIAETSLNKESTNNLVTENIETTKNVANEVVTPPVIENKVVTAVNEEIQKSNETIRIKLDVLDKLMMLAGELVLVRNQQQMLLNKQDQNSRTIFQRLDVVSNELQETIMRTRMQPVGNIFNKFTRLVRDLGAKLGKEIQLDIHGSEVELDKNILEALNDPLTHLIRNSCDHGIEMPDVRKGNNKSASGKVKLSAFHEGDRINIEILDDGKGIDPAVITRKVVEKGLKTEEELSKLSEKDILHLIFLPGFSTVEQVSDLSGRGVGMDVVNTSIKKLGGNIEVSSQLGKGSRILLSLPLTLAIIPSLIVVSKNNRYAIPQVNLEELICLYDSDIQKIEFAGTNEVYRLRNQLIPIIHLQEILNKSSVFSEKIKAEITENNRLKRIELFKKYKQKEVNSISLNIAILKAGNDRFGLVIDEVIGTEEIVVKPMHRLLKSLQIYSGATVLGDGRVALILDALGIVRHANVNLEDHNLNENEENELSLDKLTESRKLLLFKIGVNEQFAMNLDKIRRIEKIKLTSIENIGTSEFINLENSTYFILRLDNHFDISKVEENQEMFLVMPKNNKKIGILASKILDIGDYKIIPENIKNTTSEYGINALINNKLTMILDTDTIVNLN